MLMDLTKFQNLVTMDDSDALSRFALGQALKSARARPKGRGCHLVFAGGVLFWCPNGPAAE